MPEDSWAARSSRLEELPRETRRREDSFLERRRVRVTWPGLVMFWIRVRWLLTLAVSASYAQL